MGMWLAPERDRLRASGSSATESGLIATSWACPRRHWPKGPESPGRTWARSKVASGTRAWTPLPDWPQHWKLMQASWSEARRMSLAEAEVR
jgi:hypothetical protein